MMRTRMRHQRLILGLLIILTVSAFVLYESEAQTSNILLSDTKIHSILFSNETSIIRYSTSVTNRGPSEIDKLEIRVDVRALTVHQHSLHPEIRSISTSVVDTYNILTVFLNTPLISDASVYIYFTIRTEDIQEQYGICPDTGLCLNNMIFYVRPLHEFRNVTLLVQLPTHAILANDSSPIFPEANGNFTDGRTLGFQWHIDQILPGQESVYIVKYGHLVIESPVVDVPIDNTVWILFALVVGALSAIVIERVPKVISQFRQQKTPVVVGITQHENEVLRLLQRKGGSCPQRLIYEELDMSQSLASMVLSGLEERGLIKRMRDGRENVVHIIED